MMTKERADAWAWDCATNGTRLAIEEYQKSNGLGSIAEGLLKQLDAKFKYGIECGILIAVAKIFGKEKK